MKLAFSRQIFEEPLNIKFHENPPSGNRVVPCVRTDGWTDMTKLIVAFRNLANTPKNGGFSHLTIEKISFRETFLKCPDSFYPLRHLESNEQRTCLIPWGCVLWQLVLCLVVTSISEKYASYLFKTVAEALSFPKYSQPCPTMYSVIIQSMVNRMFITTANISNFRRKLSSSGSLRSE